MSRHGLGATQTHRARLPARRAISSPTNARAAGSRRVGRGESRAPLSYRSWDAAKLEVVDVELVARAARTAAANVERRVCSIARHHGLTAARRCAGRHGARVVPLGAFELTRSSTPAKQQAHAARRGVRPHRAAAAEVALSHSRRATWTQKIRYRFENHGERRWSCPSAPASAAGSTAIPPGCRCARAARSMRSELSADERATRARAHAVARVRRSALR